MTDKIKNKIEQLLNQKIEELKKSYQKHIENDEDEEFNDDYWYLSPIGDNEVKSINSVNVVDVKIVKLDRFKSLGFPDDTTQLQVKVNANVNNNVDEFDEIIPELESALEIFADSVRVDFNQIIKEQKRRINEVNDETLQKVATNWFKRQISRGEDPHIDGSLLMFLGSKPMDSTFVYIMDSIENFLGPETSYKVGLKRSKKTFDTNNYPDITGGYSFKFNLDLEEFDGTQYLFNVNVLPDAEVTLVMTDDTTHKIKDIINHEDIGWEIESEMNDVIDGIMIREICFYTGFFTTINKVELT